MARISTTTDGPFHTGESHRWSFVYLHGAAEDAAGTDIFAADVARPSDGVHVVEVDGVLGLAFVWRHATTVQCGLVVRCDDADALAHAVDLFNRKAMP